MSLVRNDDTSSPAPSDDCGIHLLGCPTTPTQVQPSPPSSQLFVTVVQPNDVLMGRGTPAVQHVGNIRFREELIAPRKQEYSSTSRQQTKCDIARQIMNQLQQRNGRFLCKIKPCPSEARRLGVPEGTTEAYTIATDDAAIEKIKQSLRDRDPKPSKVNANMDKNQAPRSIPSDMTQDAPRLSPPTHNSTSSSILIQDVAHPDHLHSPHHQPAVVIPYVEPNSNNNLILSLMGDDTAHARQRIALQQQQEQQVQQQLQHLTALSLLRQQQQQLEQQRWTQLHDLEQQQSWTQFHSLGVPQQQQQLQSHYSRATTQNGISTTRSEHRCYNTMPPGMPLVAAATTAYQPFYEVEGFPSSLSVSPMRTNQVAALVYPTTSQSATQIEQQERYMDQKRSATSVTKKKRKRCSYRR